MTVDTFRTIAQSAATKSDSTLWRTIIDTLPIAVYLTDAEGRLTYFNSAAATLSGRAPELSVDKWCVTWKLFLPDGTPLPHDQCPMAIALRGEKVPEGVECIAERPDGTQFWFTPYPTVLRDEDGRIAGGVNLLVDITARKLAEIATERAQRLLSAIVDSSDDAIISKNLNSIITSWNKSAERLFGYTSEEVIGKPINLLIPSDRQDEEPSIIGRLMRGERVDHFETVRRRKNGTLVDISLTISPIRDSSGRVVGASKIARDITKGKRAEAEILRANRDLEHFAFAASHDLQEPLRTITIYSELLGTRHAGKLDEQAIEYLHYVRNAATRMGTLVSDLLSYAQVSKLEESEELTDANEALARAIECLSHTIAENEARVSSESLPAVTMHRTHLQQLFQNLVGNALKYRKKDLAPEVHISAEQQAGRWIFTVRDNGIGISQQYKEYVFGIFKRLHTSSEYAGTGIGLATCRRIVDQYQGEIWVESEPGEGSIFRFAIPDGA